jgi:Ca2+-transporting ATPase
MLALLLGGGVVYLALGDLKEALILLAFATMSVLITVVQETRTERVLEALRDLTSPRALVIRDGERRRIAGREVVRGDLVVLAEGDRVPAALQGDVLVVRGAHGLPPHSACPTPSVARVYNDPRSNTRPGAHG